MPFRCVLDPNPLVLRPLVGLLDIMLTLIKGALVAPQAIEQHLLNRFRLLGGSGLVTMAIAGIDMAAWDALGKAANMPLVRLWGGEPRPVQAYNSTGGRVPALGLR